MAEQLVGIKRHSHNGKSYTAAYSREAYSTDKLVAWQGDRRRPTREWCIRALETEQEFFERVERELQ
jgi:hypothetical protein